MRWRMGAFRAQTRMEVEPFPPYRLGAMNTSLRLLLVDDSREVRRTIRAVVQDL